MDADGQDIHTPNYSRFRDEEEVKRYLDYVRETVRELKGIVTYYELLNEPNPPWDFYQRSNDEDPDLFDELRFGNQQTVRLPDYISLIERVVPVIKEEDPQAKIAVGAVCEIQPGGQFKSFGQEYLFGLIESRVMPLVDAVTFHPLYNVTPQGEELQQYAVDVDYGPPLPEDVQDYYDNYPALLRQMQETAENNGFDGVFIADETVFWSNATGFPIHHPAPPYVFPEMQATKYYLRSIITHHGSDMKAIISHAENIRFSLKNLSPVMAGHEATDIPVEIEIDFDPIAYYTFSYPNGDRMLAVWTDGIAQDENPGTPAKITFPGFTADIVRGIDVLHGFEQDLVFEVEDGSTVIRDFLVKDYPLMIRLGELPDEPTFSDVPADHLFFTEVEALATSGISEGYDDGTFRPSANVSRMAMAAFLYRGLNLTDPGVTEPTFSDVPETHPFFAEIEALAASGITTGWPDGTFRPSANVTRMAMAVFLVRGLGLDIPEVDQPTFSDVPETHPFFAEVEALAASGITTGWPDGTFRPSANVSRMAMAAFLVRGLELD